MHAWFVASVVSDAHRFRRDQAIDLSRLNGAELGVLRLLAEGHTAKSIANATDSTPAAVNERLREARRKTGVCSSRELARLLRAHENRHEQMGMGRPRPFVGAHPQLVAEPWRPQMGVIAMIAIFLVVAAGATAMLSEPPTPTNEIDPLIGTPLLTPPSPAALHRKLRSEPRDPAWAPRMESAVRARVLQIELIGKDGNALRVTCASTLCEIAGTLAWPKPAPKEYDPKLLQNRAMADLQDKALNDDLAKLGLTTMGASFMQAKTPDVSAFLLYYSRTAKPPSNPAHR